MKSALPSLRTVKIGNSTRIDYDDVLRIIGRDPAAEPSDRPKAVSIRTTMQALQVSRATVNRMIARGRAGLSA